MATRNVAEPREERKRGSDALEAARREMRSAVARYAAAVQVVSGILSQTPEHTGTASS